MTSRSKPFPPGVSPAIGAAVLLAAMALLWSPGLAAQAVERDPIPLSQYQMVVQSLGWGEVTVEYRRPVARGRELFGALVPWDQEWTPSADSAAVVTFTEDVLFAGRPVAAGSYSLWLVPRADDPWTVILSRAARVFHAPYPEGQDLLRADLRPERSSHMESLGIHFPKVDGAEAELAIQWGETLLRIPVRLGEAP